MEIMGINETNGGRYEFDFNGTYIELLKSKDLNKLYVSDNSRINSFKVFGLICKIVESWGYRLNIAEGCYERL